MTGVWCDRATRDGMLTGHQWQRCQLPLIPLECTIQILR